jgi:hypothetical protein
VFSEGFDRFNAASIPIDVFCVSFGVSEEPACTSGLPQMAIISAVANTLDKYIIS